MNYVTGQPSSIIVSNNLIANNGSNGVRIRCDTSLFINNTIVNNGGYGLFCDDYALYMRMVNCISWGNQYSSVYLLIADTLFSYSDVEGLQMNATPLFVSPSAGYGLSFDGLVADWSLSAASPCINAGDPVGLYPLVDLAGNPRVVGGRVDIGAFEFSGITSIGFDEWHDNVTLSPNPFSYFAVLEGPGIESIVRIEIFDLSGKRVKDFIPQNAERVRVDRNGLSDGIFVIRLTSHKNISTSIKFIVE
jgi:hypothetical protein